MDIINMDDFFSLAEVEDKIFSFQERYQEVAEPFERKFTRADLDRLCVKLKCNEGINERELVAACC